MAWAELPGALSAQTPQRDRSSADAFGAIDGTVIDTSGASLPLVEVVILDAPSTRARTGSGGGYRIDSIAAGLHLVRFRRVGLMPVTASITVRAADVTDVDAVLGPIPQRLAEVTIQNALGEMIRLPEEVRARTHSGMGSYMTAADIERHHVTRTSEALQYLPGVELTKDGVINNTRGVISLLTDGCKYGLPVYIDGQKIDDPNADQEAPHGSALTDLVQPSTIALIEVYRGPSEVPATLPQDKCGGVFIWTKR
jgi:hypothetical protein